jgi:hypothetical protein
MNGEISGRAAGELEELFSQLEQLPKTIQAYINALGAQLDIAPGWRFDRESMAFVPPTNPAVTVQGESISLSGERTE